MREHKHNWHRTVADIAVNLLLQEFSISTLRVDFHEYSDATPNTLSICPVRRQCIPGPVSPYSGKFP